MSDWHLSPTQPSETAKPRARRRPHRRWGLEYTEPIETGAMSGSHLFAWEALGRYGPEAAHVRFDDRSHLSARSAQLGTGDIAYQLEYQLETDQRRVTRRLQVEVQGLSWTRRIDLGRDTSGAWDCESCSAVGDSSLASPGRDIREVDGAFDSERGFSPLTNLMPVRREGIDAGDPLKAGGAPQSTRRQGWTSG